MKRKRRRKSKRSHASYVRGAHKAWKTKRAKLEESWKDLRAWAGRAVFDDMLPRPPTIDLIPKVTWP